MNRVICVTGACALAALVSFRAGADEVEYGLV